MTGTSAGDPWQILQKLPAGRRVRLSRAGHPLAEGTIVPSHEFSGDRVMQLKLESGYNVGIRILPTDAVEVLGETPPPARAVTPVAGVATVVPSPPGAPLVSLLTTGGTIASRVDYRTGGVYPVQGEAEILAFYPDLARDGPVRVVPVLDRLSEDLTPEDWHVMARKVVESFTAGARGVVIAHGTDTLAFSAAALSFLVQDLPGPVVLVGAQRSPDRPSSDGPSNLEAGVRVARTAELGEVVVVMHDGLSDTRFAIHRGSRARKMHSSRRDAFESRNGPPLGILEGDQIQWAVRPRPRGAGTPRVIGQLEPRVGLLWWYPGLDPARAEAFASGQRGVVLAGTGLGHVAAAHLPWIRSAVARGAIVVMTTQCLEGPTDPYVYATGRELLRAGVVYAADLLPEVAFVKLAWSLGQSPDPVHARELFLRDQAGEFEPRHLVSEAE